VAIRVHDDRFEVFANNKHLAYFPHRINPKAVDYLQVFVFFRENVKKYLKNQKKIKKF
jgi:hypothetical protein